MWQFKKNRKGLVTPAVFRRSQNFEADLYSLCNKIQTSHESRARFGYCYLEYVRP